MAAFDHARDLNDPKLKPRLLEGLLKEHIPSEDRPLANPDNIAFVVWAAKTHELLSEEIPHKAASTWSSAVDAWVDRIMWLARCDLTDKCWAGVCLLGVTSVECSSERFLASFSDWCNIFLSHIQSPGVSQIVRVASCAALSDLLTRLGGFSNVKKDGTSLAGKLVPPIMKIFSENATELMEVAAHLLFTVLTNFPSSVQRYYDNVEAAIVSKIFSGNCSPDVLKELSCCLALLPQSRADEKSWSLMMQKILLALSALLDSALEGLEEESLRGEALALLAPPGKDPPPSLGGQVIGGGFGKERSQQAVVSAILSLVQCCCTMLTKPYPVQVLVPVRPLLAVVRRVLMVNGSLSEALHAFTTSMQQELVCLQLPVLHKILLDILAALNKGLRSQILPHGAEIIWLLIKYFEKCRLPELRTKAYSIIRALLVSMGAGMALYIYQDVIDNVLIDLNATDSGGNGEPSNVLSVELSTRHHKKKRKRGKASESSVEQNVPDALEQKELTRLILLKIAAIEALEALLSVGGALKSADWRGGIDHLLMEVATNACKVGWNCGGKPFLLRGSGAAAEDFQLVALRALLVSLLCPAGVRPPHLAQGLELFRQGKQISGTKVSEFCARSLMTLEVLIHPRALSLIDASLPTTNSFGRIDFGGSKYKSPIVGNRVHGVYPDVYDIQDYANMEDGFATEVPAVEVPKTAVFDGKGLDSAMAPDDTNINDGSFGKVKPDGRDERSEPTSSDNNIEGNMDTVMLDTPSADSDLPAKTAIGKDASASVNREPMSGMLVPAVTNTSSPVPESEVAARTDVSAPVNREAMSGMLVPVAKGTASVTSVSSGDAATTDYGSLKRTVDNDSEMSDSLPDIVDADPDTASSLGSDSDS